MKNKNAINILCAALGIFVKVKNLNGTSDKKCTKCGSWIEHWVKKTNGIVDKCSCIGCGNDAEVGAHVKKVGIKDMHHYIVPLCQSCNQKTGDFLVLKDVLTSAKKCSEKAD